MPRKIQPDRWLFIVTVALCFVGIVMVFSASAVTARENFGGAYTFFAKQFAFLVVGGAGMWWLMNFDYRKLRDPAIVFTVMTGVLVLLIVVLFLDKSHATHRWIRFGPVGIQPSELAKLAVILYLAWFLDMRCAPRRFEEAPGVNDPLRALLPALAPPLVMAALVVIQPDLGTAFELFVISLAMLFVAGLSLRYVAYATLAAVPLIYLLIMRVPYRYNRIIAFMNPEVDPQGTSFQLLQSLIAVGSGGFTGVGLMESRQKLFYLPEAFTDFIFAVLCEELGFVGGAIVLALFGIYGWRGLRTALGAPDSFGRFAALGITAMVMSQALINLSVVLGLMPTKGIPLPFISYGGSSLVVMLLATGVLLNISQHAEE